MKNNAVLEIGLDKLEFEAAARVAQRFVLKEIFLVDAKVSRDPRRVPPEVLSLEHKCSTDNLSTSDEGKRLTLCNFQVTAFNGKEPRELIMQIEASFCASYVINPDIIIPDDVDAIITHVEYLMTINPISEAWPYWREFAQNMSARMGFPALTVPMLEIVPNTPEEKGKGDTAKKASARHKKRLSV